MNKKKSSESFILSKVESLQNYLELELRPYIAYGPKKYATSPRLRREIQYSLDLAFMTALDLNHHIHINFSKPAPKNLADSFLGLVELGIYPTNLAETLAHTATHKDELMQKPPSEAYEEIVRVLALLHEYITWIFASPAKMLKGTAEPR